MAAFISSKVLLGDVETMASFEMNPEPAGVSQ